MATIEKSRARAPLAEGMIGYSWRLGEDRQGCYNFSIRGETHSFQLSVNNTEALGMLSWVAGRMTLPATILVDKRALPEKLRALADQLEKRS